MRNQSPICVPCHDQVLEEPGIQLGFIWSWDGVEMGRREEEEDGEPLIV